MMWESVVHTFSVGGSISWEYVGVVHLSDVIQADAQAHIVDNLRWRQQCQRQQHFINFFSKYERKRAYERMKLDSLVSEQNFKRHNIEITLCSDTCGTASNW